MKAFCIFIDTFFQGPSASVRDAFDRPYLFETKVEAQREIADNAMTRLQQFLDGERDYEDATTIEEYVSEVEVCPDGSILNESGQPIT